MTIDEAVEEFIKDIKVEQQREKIKIEYRKILKEVFKETNRIYKKNEHNIESFANKLNQKTKKELIDYAISQKIQTWMYFVKAYPERKNTEVITD